MRPYLQAFPLTAILLGFLLLPLLAIVVVSFWDYDSVQIIPAFTLQNYADVLGSAVTWRTYANTLNYAAIVWAIVLPLGFGVAWFLAFEVRSASMQTALFLVCTVPFLTSNIIRMIAWVPSLGRNGLVNGALLAAAFDRPADRAAPVLRLRDRAGLRASLRAVHGGPGVQLDGAHRPPADRGGARRRRIRRAGRCGTSSSRSAARASASAAPSSWRW